MAGEGVGIWFENAFDSLADGNRIFNVANGIQTINYGPNISAVEYRTIDTHTIISNNLIFNTSKNGIICYASPGGKALNNTLYNTLQYSESFASIALAYYGGYFCHNWEIKNNLISKVNKYALWYVSPPTGLTSLSSDYNFIDLDPSETKLIWEIYNDTSRIWNQYSLAQIQSQKKLELHSVLGNPLFVNVTKQNFQLQASSPAINKGTNLGLFTDLDGNPRPQGAGFDIGAFEALLYEELFKLFLPLSIR